MRSLLLLALFSAPLMAMDAEGVRLARRTLLDEGARKYLDAGVGDVGALSACQVLRGDFDGDGKADFAAVVRNGKAVVAALFPASRDASAPLSIMKLRMEIAPDARVVATVGRDCVCLQTLRKTDVDGETREITEGKLLRWHDGWLDALQFTPAQTRVAAQARFRRETTARVETRGAKCELVTESRDLLDGKELEGSQTRTTAELTVAEGGAFVLGKSSGEDTPVPTRVQLARTLEREGLLQLAVEQAREATAKAERDKLAANDARLLDARAVQQRLEARLAAMDKPVVSR